ncbi:MAG: glycerol kinase GlpK [Planctomycetota bacterium]|jgi:glycerol kinase
MRHVLALDQGTTSSRAILFDEGGSVAGVAQREFRQIFPRPGWVEHDPEEIWTTQIEVAAEVLAAAGLRPADVAAIGITNQRETTIAWDRRTGRAIGHAIVWQDRRTAPMIDRLKADGVEPLLTRKTGLVADAYFSGSKMAWLLEHVPEVRAAADGGHLAFGTVDSWLVHRLTDGALYLTDASNASRTLLYDIHAGAWDDELLEIFGVPRSALPEVRASSEVYGAVAPSLPLAGVPVAGIAGDQQAALMGQLCLERSMAKNTFGTGCFLLMNTGPEPVASKSGLVTTVAWRLGGETAYALEGSVFIGGAVVQWLRDGLGLIETAPEIESLAATVEDNGDVYLVPAFAGLGAPHWDPYARGTIVGITRGTTAGHLARAALESIVLQVADLADAMQADAGLRLPELRVDGGAAENDMLMQLQADVLQVPIVRPRVTETTALGAAYLAGLAVGFWRSTGDLAANWQVDRRFEPAMDPDRVAALRARWSEAVERARGWARGDAAP